MPVRNTAPAPSMMTWDVTTGVAVGPISLSAELMTWSIENVCPPRTITSVPLPAAQPVSIAAPEPDGFATVDASSFAARIASWSEQPSMPMPSASVSTTIVVDARTGEAEPKRDERQDTGDQDDANAKLPAT